MFIDGITELYLKVFFHWCISFTALIHARAFPQVWDEAKRLRCEWYNDYEKTASKPPMVIADLEVVELNFRGLMSCPFDFIVIGVDVVTKGLTSCPFDFIFIGIDIECPRRFLKYE